MGRCRFKAKRRSARMKTARARWRRRGWLSCTAGFTFWARRRQTVTGQRASSPSTEVVPCRGRIGQAVWKMWHCHFSWSSQGPRMAFENRRRAMAKVREISVSGFSKGPHTREFAAHLPNRAKNSLRHILDTRRSFYRGAFTVASAIACGTSKIKIGLGIVIPFYGTPRSPRWNSPRSTKFQTVARFSASARGLKDWIEGALKIHIRSRLRRCARVSRIIRAFVSRRRGHICREGVSDRANQAELQNRPRHRDSDSSRRDRPEKIASSRVRWLTDCC